MKWVIIIWVISIILGVMLRSTKGFVLALFLGPVGFLLSLFFKGYGQTLYDELTTKEVIRLTGDGSFSYEIVGESFYQNNIKKSLNLSGGRSSKSFEVRLLYDDDNSCDKNAIAVYIGLDQAGHLSRKAAISYRKMLSDVNLSHKPAICNATVVGGGIKKNYGIFLDFNARKTKQQLSKKVTT